MTTITAEVIADSVSQNSIRLTTMRLRYPRVIHSELLTHRVFSRNASSSRAIPVERLIREVELDPYVPASWGANQPGMQAGEELPELALLQAKTIYDRALNSALADARAMSRISPAPHKQIINRILEPYSHITVLVTSTCWANWFALRDHKDAEPNICVLAQRMMEAMSASVPTELEHDGWHLPFIERDGDEIEHAAIKVLEDNPAAEGTSETLEKEIFFLLAKISVARCARVSYNNLDGSSPRIEKDLERYEKLMKSAPLHASPAEHQAQPDRLIGPTWEAPGFHGNFVGWRQFRKYFVNENVRDKPYTGPRITADGVISLG